MNSRVIRTKRALRSALFLLLETTSMEHISVSALCRTAHVTRKTFYTHYDTVVDVFEDFQEDTAMAVQAALERGTMNADRLLTTFDQILMVNFTAFRYLCLQTPEPQLVTDLKNMLFETFSDQLVAGTPTGPQQLILHSTADTVVNSYIYWFRNPDTLTYQDVVATNTTLLNATSSCL